MVGIGQYFSNFHYLPHPKKQTIKQNAVIRFSFACVFGMIYLALIYAILVIKHFSFFSVQIRTKVWRKKWNKATVKLYQDGNIQWSQKRNTYKSRKRVKVKEEREGISPISPNIRLFILFANITFNCVTF